MPAGLVVGRRSTPVLHQEEGKVMLWFRQVFRVERSQERVTGDPEVEGINEVEKELLPADPVEECVHDLDGRRSRLLLRSRP
jgi:hypothetical protein